MVRRLPALLEVRSAIVEAESFFIPIYKFSLVLISTIRRQLLEAAKRRVGAIQQDEGNSSTYLVRKSGSKQLLMMTGGLKRRGAVAL